MYTDVHEHKNLDVETFRSQLLFPIIYEPALHCIWNGAAATDAECQHANSQHVHVDMYYFSTQILVERGNPEAYQLYCPRK